jgi:hypothetical protein
VRSKDLVVGQRYRIKYRKFTATGNSNYGYPLTEGEGVLESMYDVSSYNHTFVLDDGEYVWATPNSIYELTSSQVPKSSVSLVSDILSAPEDVVDVRIFLDGLGIDSWIADDHLIIPPTAILKLKNLVYTLYSDILS